MEDVSVPVLDVTKAMIVVTTVTNGTVSLQQQVHGGQQHGRHVQTTGSSDVTMEDVSVPVLDVTKAMIVVTIVTNGTVSLQQQVHGGQQHGRHVQTTGSSDVTMEDVSVPVLDVTKAMIVVTTVTNGTVSLQQQVHGGQQHGRHVQTTGSSNVTMEDVSVPVLDVTKAMIVVTTVTNGTVSLQQQVHGGQQHGRHVQTTGSSNVTMEDVSVPVLDVTKAMIVVITVTNGTVSLQQQVHGGQQYGRHVQTTGSSDVTMEDVSVPVLDVTKAMIVVTTVTNGTVSLQQQVHGGQQHGRHVQTTGSSDVTMEDVSVPVLDVTKAMIVVITVMNGTVSLQQQVHGQQVSLL